MNVVYLPGLLGSGLSIDRGDGSPPSPLWPDPGAVLNGGLADLDLAPDGISPGPLARCGTVIPTSVFAPVYGPLYYFMLALGWDVFAVPWDWRLSVLSAAPAVWNDIKLKFGQQPIYIVAHSQGGLLARAVYGAMVAEGRGGQLGRIVTLCTPHYGSVECVRLFSRLPFLYQVLVTAAGWRSWLPGSPGPGYIDAVLASCGFGYELLPFAGEGPLFESAPDQAAAIYHAGFYTGGNPNLVQTSFDGAKVDQAVIAGDLPAGLLVSVLGTGVQTPYQLSANGPPTSQAGYLYTGAGDGLVTVAEGSLAGYPALAFPGDHATICLSPLVWAALAGIVPNGVPG